MTKTRTLFHTLTLATGDWMIEVHHNEATTHYDLLPVELAEMTLPVDPWGDQPLHINESGTPIWEATQMLPVLTTVGRR